jgi:hypothetical protein
MFCPAKGEIPLFPKYSFYCANYAVSSFQLAFG